jgi:hypothetical protein
MSKDLFESQPLLLLEEVGSPDLFWLVYQVSEDDQKKALP